MEEVKQAFMVLAPFFGVLLLMVAPGVVSVVNRVRSLFEKQIVPGYVWWIVSIVVSTAAALYVNYLFGVVGLYQPPLGVVAGLGVLTGLQSSGLIDISKYIAGTKR